jgi:protein TonB
MAIATADFDDNGLAFSARRWAVCFAAILALHVAGFWLAQIWWPDTEPSPEGPPAVAMIELAPLLVAPPITAPPVPQEPVPPPPIEETAPPSPAPIIAAPLPPKPKPVKHQPVRVPPPPIEAAPPTEAPPSPVLAAPPATTVAPRSGNPVQSWQGLLNSRLEQFKRYPSLAAFRHQEGVVYLHFTMDRQGQVLSARIEKTSGFDALDEETLALIRRAAPLPPPPPEIPGDPVALTVPVQFFLK